MKCHFKAKREVSGGKPWSGYCHKLIFLRSLSLSPCGPLKADPEEGLGWKSFIWKVMPGITSRKWGSEAEQGDKHVEDPVRGRQPLWNSVPPRPSERRWRTCPGIAHYGQGYWRVSPKILHFLGFPDSASCQGRGWSRLWSVEAAMLRGESRIRVGHHREGNNLCSALCLIQCFSDTEFNVWNQQIWIRILTYNWILISLNIDLATHLSFWHSFPHL